ncbi:MAG: GNAT family N-acetyltransferase, partial [Pyrinomonadaceae bacterium]
MARARPEHNFHIITGSPSMDLHAAWDDLLQHARFATHYTTPDFFKDPFVGAGERFAILALSGERVDAALTGVSINSKATSGMPVRPQTVFRANIAPISAAAALAKGLSSFGADLNTFYSWTPLDGLERLGYVSDQASGGDQVVMLDLSKGPDALFSEFTSGRRTDLRKAIRSALVEVKMLETEQEIKELYCIHRDWTGRKGFAADRFDDFRAAARSQYRAILVAKYQGQMIAGSYLRFSQGGVVEYAANNSLLEYQKLDANKLLVWRAIEWACASGFAYFSLGASHPFLTR